MSALSPERQAALRVAEDRARAILKPGDRLRVRRCAGVRINVTMTGWDGRWITSRKYNDIHAAHIEKVNGKPVNFCEVP